ncbi:MAG: ABC transporter permease subunit [Verrucomicrobiota bacterium]|nr:ABC transporter permease subunit [Verrucomicrobiota bacterium]
MKIFWTLARRELAAYFLSVTGYVIIAAAAFLIGLSFVVLINGLGNQPSPVPVTELFYQTPYFWLIVLLAAPVITMRLFALEKFSGTFETLMTAPVGDVQVVAAKFTAAIVFYLVMWLPLLACLFVVSRFTDQQGTLDAGTIGGMFLGVFLVGCLFLAAGCFTSALTRSQMAAAMVAFVLGVSLFSFGFLARAIPAGAPQWESQVIGYFDLFDQINDLARGVVDTRAVILYTSLAFFFLFLTLRVVESRRWK